MPSPYFLLSVRFSFVVLLFPERLSHGATYSGRCPAAAVGPPPAPPPARPLGPAACAPPPPRRAAVVVFLFTRSTEEGQLVVTYDCEKHYEPVSRGTLTIDLASSTRLVQDPAPCIQRMAECCIETFQQRS